MSPSFTLSMAACENSGGFKHKEALTVTYYQTQTLCPLNWKILKSDLYQLSWNYFLMHLMNADGVWEASEKTLVLIVGLHEEVKVFLWLQGKRNTQE